MKVKNVDLRWYVLNHNFNTDVIEMKNIFFSGFSEMIRKDIKKRKIENRLQFKEYLAIQFKYYYRSRCEAEILVGGLFMKFNDNKEVMKILDSGPYKDDIKKYDVMRDLYNLYMSRFEKIDIWYQIEPNLDLITDYVIDKMQLFK